MFKWLAVALTTVFAAAKVTGYITWGWLAVFSPAVAYVVLYLLIVWGLGKAASKIMDEINDS